MVPRLQNCTHLANTSGGYFPGPGPWCPKQSGWTYGFSWMPYSISWFTARWSPDQWLSPVHHTGVRWLPQYLDSVHPSSSSVPPDRCYRLYRASVE